MKRIFLGVLFFCLASQEIIAVGINYKQVILSLLNAPNRVFQFFAQVETTNYSYQEQELIIKNSYQQEILWVRNEFLSVEIFDEQDELAYLVYQNLKSDKKFIKRFSKKTLFSNLDVEYLFTGFYAKTEAKLFQFYESLGINYFHLELVEQNNQYYYKLGEDSAYIFLNKENYRTEKLVRSIYYSGKKLQFVVIFKDWNPQKPLVPQTIDYYLNDMLFKTEQVFFLKFRGLAARRNNLIDTYE